MNGQTTTFDAYHIMPKMTQEVRSKAKRKVPRIDFDTPRGPRPSKQQIDPFKVEQYRSASRHDQHMEYFISSLFAIISIVGVVAFIISF